MTSANLERYTLERERRRAHTQGLAGYAAVTDFDLKKVFIEDPWLEDSAPVSQLVSDGDKVKIVVFGAGLSGLILAIECVRTGAVKDSSEILIIDPAGGFGGTWYYHRYPGLFCDVESYQYLPYLEEMGYMPKHRYSAGEEIRAYFERLASHFNLHNRAMFGTRGVSTRWTGDHWSCEVLQRPQNATERTVRFFSDFVVLCSGLAPRPKLPKVPGIASFQGQQMHTSRWRYDITGGSPDDPTLHGLAGKRVAVVGTSATAVQVIPEVAKYAKELFVVQRTPVAVGVRQNVATDPVDWQTVIAKKPGWQRQRSVNSQTYMELPLHGNLPEKFVIGDGWTEFPSVAGVLGSPSYNPETVTDPSDPYLESLYKADDDFMSRLRTRVKDTVSDPKTAEDLQPWYHGWCKPPVFNDEYLPTFNKPYVHLIDSDGKGLERLTDHGFVVNGKEYEADVIIWATGYVSAGSQSYAGKAGIEVTGRDSKTMEGLYKDGELYSLHGLASHYFPNLFHIGTRQAGTSICNTFRICEQSAHIGNIIAQASAKFAPTEKPVIEATAEACRSWGSKVAANADRTGRLLQCTPGWLNLEGDLEKLPAEKLTHGAQFGTWGKGYLSYAAELHDWQARGTWDGLIVQGKPILGA